MGRHINVFALIYQCPIFLTLIRLVVVLPRVLLHKGTSTVKFAVYCLYSNLRAVVLYQVSLG
jgi:hypothetical protein